MFVSTRQVVYFIVISIFVALIYLPSLNHTARSDQINYLVEHARVDGWTDLAFGSYAFNRHRVFATGDELLFRPIYYFILGTEKWMFGYHFFFWQLMGIVLHLMVLWLLLRFLLARGLKIASLFPICFFASLPLCLEMVVWHHIHSYLVFALLILIVLNRLPIDAGDVLRRKDLWLITGCCTLAAFIHESGTPFALLFALYLWLFQRQRNTENGLASPSRNQPVWLIALPCVLYPAASLLEWWVAGGTGSVSPSQALHFDFFKTVGNMGIAAVWWCYAGIFPATLTFSGNPLNRIGLPPTHGLFPILGHRLGFITTVSVVAGLLAVACFLAVIAKTISRDFLKRRRLILGLLLMIAVVHVGMIAVGRMDVRGAEFILKTNLYYSYLFWIIVTIVAALSVDFQKVSTTVPKWILGGLFVSLIWLIGFDGFLVHRINTGFAEQCRPIRLMIKEVAGFITLHQSEKDLTISVDRSLSGNPVILHDQARDGSTNQEYRLVQVLYPQFYKNDDAKYHFNGITWRSTSEKK